MKYLKNFNQLNEKKSELPDVPIELEEILTMPNSGAFVNRIIVNIDDDWYEYNKGLYSDPEWSSIKYSDNNDEQKRIIFDQDVIPGSENNKISKEFKKWLKSKGLKIKEVYLGET